MKQASVLYYMDVFLYLGIMFLICIPFVLLVKSNRKQKLDFAEQCINLNIFIQKISIV
ncbi:MAG: hypothetical protein ABIQ07_10745 [Ginsengibacter sp.]